MNNDDYIRTIYNEAYNYLFKIKPDSITNNQLNKYFSVTEGFHTKNDILENLCGSLQNYQRMPNVIAFYQKKETFKRILFNFDCDKILNSYITYKELLNVFIKEFNLDTNGLERKNNSWVKYSKAVLSACTFMNQFKDVTDFDHFVKLFSYNESTSAALPMLLAKEIYGMGFALGCDFLKELGYDQYPKPDVHLIDIFSELGLSDRDEYNCYKAIIRMAKVVDETPYKVDKIFWLISSGNYYLDNITSVKDKKKFIEHIKDMIKN